MDGTRYRKLLGFTNQADASKFLGAKDIKPEINLELLARKNERLAHVISKLNELVSPETRVEDLDSFVKERIQKPFAILQDNNKLPKLNNEGRKPEDVYFAWIRGYTISHYLLKGLGYVFDQKLESITIIGDDDIARIESFKKTPSADFGVPYQGGVLRLETQTGMTGQNDVKEHKFEEAWRVKESGHPTTCVHFDLFNGKVAIVDLDSMERTEVERKLQVRTQYEGKKVYPIPDDLFTWDITSPPPKYREISQR